MTRIVVVGDLMTDTVARATLPLAKGSDTPAAVSTHGGGSGANIAAWLAVDGAEVAFVGRRGADIAGRNRDMELMGYGVDARLVMDPERPTGNCVVMITHRGDNTMMSDPGANAALSPDDLPKDLFTPGCHLHVSGYTLLNEGSRPAAVTAIDYARRADMTISVDGASVAPLERVGAEPYLELTNGATLLFVNAGTGGRADRARGSRAGRPGADGVVPAGRGQAGRRRCPVRERPPRSHPRARADDGAVHGRDRQRGRVLRRVPDVVAGQEAAAGGAGERLPPRGARPVARRRPARPLTPGAV